MFLYECSDIGSSAFRKKGHTVYSCDYKKSETNSPWHIKGNVWDYDWSFADLLIAHPDCTYITNAGVRWFYEQPGRWDLMMDSAIEFKKVLDLPVKRIAVENPIPHKYALEIIGRKYDQLVQPWQFGVGETKATCFWLKNLPHLKPTKIAEGRIPRVHHEPPSPERKANRARTCVGIAEAMTQWGQLSTNLK